MRTHKQPSRVVPRRPYRPARFPTPPPRIAIRPIRCSSSTRPQDFHVEPLDINVYPEAERQDEIDAALELSESDEDEDERDEVDPDDMTADERTAELGDIGELYGVHLPQAHDPRARHRPDLGEYAECELGETWLETLETDTAEGGPTAGATRSIRTTTATTRDGHHSTESGDRPVADKGSGGPAGL